ncbi:MAG: hypothetical protein AAF937_05160 [Planctomycetota bacterium]
MAGSDEQRHVSDIHAYLDGELDAKQTQRLAARRTSDAKLDARITELSQVDELLRVEFGYLSDKATTAMRPPRRHGRLAVLATAAALLLATMVWLHGVPNTTPETTRRPLQIAELYLRHTQQFVPDVICDTPSKFIAYTQTAFGSGVKADFNSDLNLIGWKASVYQDDRDNDDGSRILLATNSNDDKIITVFVPDGPYAMRSRATINGTSISAFRQQVGDITVIELSPLSEPSVLRVLSEAP